MVANKEEITGEKIWQLLKEVCDPEIPVLSIIDLGIVKTIQVSGEKVQVNITPTYSGCPAMHTIALDIQLKLLEAGYKLVEIVTQLSPPWTTDNLSEAGKEKLKAFGIAPPVETTININILFGKEITVKCPQCNSENTELISQFGSTACKALYKCNNCLEPFDYFKCLK